MGTIAERGVMECVLGWGGGCQCLPNHPKEGDITGMQEQRS